MGELPGGKDLLGLPPGEVLDRSGGTEDPEETKQDQGEAVCDDEDLFLKESEILLSLVLY